MDRSEKVTEATISRLQAAAASRRIGLEDALKSLADRLEATPVYETEREFTAAEREVLEAEGLDQSGVADKPLVGAFGAELRLHNDAYDAGAAAKKMGVSNSRVRQLLGSRRLYGIKQGRDWRLPRWQFKPRGAGTVPGIEAVIEAMPADLHPLSAQGFMTASKPELEVGGKAVSPLEWLGGGGDPAAVARLAQEL